VREIKIFRGNIHDIEKEANDFLKKNGKDWKFGTLQSDGIVMILVLTKE